MLDTQEAQDPTVFDPATTYLEPTCGDGAFVVEILRRKFERCQRPADYRTALESVYGFELQADNVRACIRNVTELCHAGIVDRPERQSGAWKKPDPTGNAAMALADHPDAKRVKLIEQCVAAVAEPVVARGLLLYVTKGRAWEYQSPRPPIGRNQFYVTAQLFYIELDRCLE